MQKLHEILEANTDLLTNPKTATLLSWEEVRPYAKLINALIEGHNPTEQAYFIVVILTNSLCGGVITKTNDVHEVAAMFADDEDDLEYILANSFQINALCNHN